MINTDLISSIDRLIDRWERKQGLFIALFIFIGVYYYITSSVGLDGFSVYWHLVAPGIICLVILGIWLYSNNLFFIKSSNCITAGVIIMIDNDGDRIILTKIVKKVIHIINKSGDYPNIKFKLLPTNYKLTKKETEHYHATHGYMYDLIFRLDVNGGKFKSLEKISIKNFSITFTPKVKKKTKKIFFDEIELSREMALQAGARNWEYDLANSGIDNSKYLENLNQIFLYYLSFYAIYVDRYEEALTMMTAIYDSKKTIVPIKKQGNKLVSLSLRKINISEGRIATILIDLFFALAVKSYFQKETQKALKYFERLKAMLGKHPREFDQFTNMARYSYELGDLDNAKQYTDEASKVNPQSVFIPLNHGFFAILEADIARFCKAYTSVFNKRFKEPANWVDVQAFLINQQENDKGNQVLLNFAIQFIEFVFLKTLSRDNFRLLVNTFEDDQQYKCLYKLGNKILTHKLSAQREIAKVKGLRKKKRRKRRRNK